MSREELIAKFEIIRAEHAHTVSVFHASHDKYARSVYLHESIELFEAAKALVHRIEMAR